MIGPILSFISKGGTALKTLYTAAKTPAVRKFAAKGLKSKGFGVRLTAAGKAGGKGLVTAYKGLDTSQKIAAATVAGGGLYVANKVVT